MQQDLDTQTSALIHSRVKRRRGESPLFEKKVFRRVVRRLINKIVGNNNMDITKECLRKLQRKVETNLSGTVHKLVKANIRDIPNRVISFEITDSLFDFVDRNVYKSDTSSVLFSDSEGGLGTDYE